MEWKWTSKPRDWGQKGHVGKRKNWLEQGSKIILRRGELRSEPLTVNMLVPACLQGYGTCSWGTALDVHLHRCIFTEAVHFWGLSHHISKQTWDFHNEHGCSPSPSPSVVELLDVLHGFTGSAECTICWLSVLYSSCSFKVLHKLAVSDMRFFLPCSVNTWVKPVVY